MADPINAGNFPLAALDAAEWNPPEKFLEDFVWKSQCSMLMEHIPEDEHAESARQVAIPGAGIADIIIRTKKRISVVEFKRNVIDEAAVGQCLRYMGALRLHYGQRFFIEGVLCAPTINSDAILAMSADVNLHYYRCSPMVVVKYEGASAAMLRCRDPLDFSCLNERLNIREDLA